MANVKVLVYHGARRPKNADDIKKYDVVITTYGLLAGDSSVEVASEKKAGKKGAQGKHGCGLLESIEWFRIILDECHRILNPTTKVALAACKLNATLRWCVSGTPMSNTTWEAFSYFKFLKCKPLGERKNFAALRKKISKDPRSGLQVLHKALLQMTLRRSKDILNLPKKECTKNIVEWTEEGDKELHAKMTAKIKEEFKLGRSKNMSRILILVMRLRRLCVHRSLVFPTSSNVEDIAPSGAKKLPAAEKHNEMVGTLLDIQDTAECCKCKGVFAGPPNILACGHLFCEQCAELDRHVGEDDSRR